MYAGKTHTLGQKDLFLLSTACGNSGTGICILSAWPGGAPGSLYIALSSQGLVVGVKRCCLQLLAVCGGSVALSLPGSYGISGSVLFPLAGCLSEGC